jgi:hypothetical protein
MTQAADLVTQVSRLLHGFGSAADRVTTLASSMDADDLTFTVTATSGTAVGISAGVIEIDSEQMYVSGVDNSSNTITLTSFGRGYNGTTAVAHNAGAKITSRPKFPRSDIFQWLNEAVASLYPTLFAVGRNLTTVAWPTDTYSIPGTLPASIIDCQWQDWLGQWRTVPSYSVDPYDNTLRLGDLYGGMAAGQPLRVLYATQPTQFAAESDDFSVTGLPASCVDVLVMAVVARMIPGLDLSRQQNTSVEQSSRNKDVPANAGLTSSQFFIKFYEDRLAEEAASLRKQYKPRLVRR